MLIRLLNFGGLFISQPLAYLIFATQEEYDNRGEIIDKLCHWLNQYSRDDQLSMLRDIPGMVIPNGDETNYLHPSEYSREVYIEKFEKHGFTEMVLEEKYYKHPSELGITSYNSLVMKKNGN